MFKNRNLKSNRNRNLKSVKGSGLCSNTIVYLILEPVMNVGNSLYQSSSNGAMGSKQSAFGVNINFVSHSSGNYLNM